MAMQVKVINWIIQYRAMFGALSTSLAGDWLEWLQENLDNCTTDEVNEAVALMASTADRGAAKPGPQQIFWAIKRARKIAAGPDDYEPDDLRKARVAVENARPEDRWWKISDIAHGSATWGLGEHAVKSLVTMADQMPGGCPKPPDWGGRPELQKRAADLIAQSRLDVARILAGGTGLQNVAQELA